MWHTDVPICRDFPLKAQKKIDLWKFPLKEYDFA
jgi:hypothetical protein